MDEPLGALDKNMRQQLQLELRRLHRRLGVTVIYVTHDQEEALAMSDRIAIMNQGRIVQVGTGQDLYEHPQSEFVARFFGECNAWMGNVAEVYEEGAGVVVEGLRLSVKNCAGVDAGEKVMIFIRPDRVRLARANERGFEASVEEMTYLGDAVRIELQVVGGPRLIARLGTRSETVEKARTVRVTWDPADVRVFSTA